MKAFNCHEFQRAPRKQSGTALISVLLIFFVATYITTEILDRVDQSIRRTSHLIAQDQAYVYAVSAEELAMQILLEDLKKDKEDNDGGAIIDDLDEMWAQQVWFPLPGGGISAELKDAQSVFNLNAFQSRPTFAAKLLRRYMEDRELFEDIQEREVFIASIQDWLDANEEPQGEGAEDYYYMGLETPYRAANAPFVSPSELRLVRGMLPLQYYPLAPQLMVLPESTPLNINTLGDAWIESLPNIENPEEIIEERSLEPFASVDEALSGSVVLDEEDIDEEESDEGEIDEEEEIAETDSNQSFDLDFFSVNSEYFNLIVDVTIDERQVRLSSLIYRPLSPSAEEPLIVLQRSRLHYYAPSFADLPPES